MEGVTTYNCINHVVDLCLGLQEMGGYFIVNGNERLIRMLIMPRRNYVRNVLHASYCFVLVVVPCSVHFHPLSSLPSLAHLPSAPGNFSPLLEEQRCSLHRVWCSDTQCAQGPVQLSTHPVHCIIKGAIARFSAHAQEDRL